MCVSLHQALPLLLLPQVVLRQRERFLTARDDEALHDLRVASRRLYSALGPLSHVKGARHLDEPLVVVRQALRLSNTVRDAEVVAELATLLAGTSDPTWLERWRAAHDTVRHQAEERFGRFAQSADLPQAVARLGRELNRLFLGLDDRDLERAVSRRYRALWRRLDRRLALGPTLLDLPDDWHALRLDCKRLRYLIDCHAGSLPAACHIEAKLAHSGQDALGDLRDLNLFFMTTGAVGQLGKQMQMRVADLHRKRSIAAHRAVMMLYGYASANASRLIE